MENKFNLSEKEIQDLQDHGFATVNGVPLSTLSDPPTKTSESQCCVCGKWFASRSYRGEDLCFEHREPQVSINRIAEQQRIATENWRRKQQCK